MGVVRFILVLLLCVPLAFCVWLALNNLSQKVKKQQEASEEIRKRKAAFQGKEKYRGDNSRFDGSGRESGKYYDNRYGDRNSYDNGYGRNNEYGYNNEYGRDDRYSREYNRYGRGGYSNSANYSDYNNYYAYDGRRKEWDMDRYADNQHRNSYRSDRPRKRRRGR